MRLTHFLPIATVLSGFAKTSFVWIAGSNSTSEPVYQHDDLNRITPNPIAPAFTFYQYTDTKWLSYDIDGNAWSFDTTTYQWQWLHGCQTTTTLEVFFSPLNVANSSICPPYLYFKHWFYDRSTNSFTVVNGNDADYNLVSVMYRVNLTSKDTTVLYANTDGPGSGSSTAPSVYGTYRVESPANLPSARSAGVYFYDESLRMFYMYGGLNWGNGNLWGDLWRFNLVTGMWSWVHGVNYTNSASNVDEPGVLPSEVYPAGRALPGYDYDRATRTFYFHGGGSWAAFTADLWSYSVDNNTFMKLAGVQDFVETSIAGPPGEFGPNYLPQSRYGHALILNSDAKVLYLCQGATPNGDNLGDFWKYDIATGQFAFVYGVLEYNHPGYNGQKLVVSPHNIPRSSIYVRGFYDSDSGDILFFSDRISTWNSDTVWRFRDDGMVYVPYESTLNLTTATSTASSIATAPSTTTAGAEIRISGPSSSSIAQASWQFVAAIAASGVVVVLALVVIVTLQMRKMSAKMSTSSAAYTGNATAMDSSSTATKTASTAYATAGTAYGSVTTTTAAATQFGNVSVMQGNRTEFGNAV